MCNAILPEPGFSKGGRIEPAEQPCELAHCEGLADRGWPELNHETALSARERKNEITSLTRLSVKVRAAQISPRQRRYSVTALPWSQISGDPRVHGFRRRGRKRLVPGGVPAIAPQPANDRRFLPIP